MNFLKYIITRPQQSLIKSKSFFKSLLKKSNNLARHQEIYEFMKNNSQIIENDIKDLELLEIAFDQLTPLYNKYKDIDLDYPKFIKDYFLFINRSVDKLPKLKNVLANGLSAFYKKCIQVWKNILLETSKYIEDHLSDEIENQSLDNIKITTYYYASIISVSPLYLDWFNVSFSLISDIIKWKTLNKIDDNITDEYRKLMVFVNSSSYKQSISTMFYLIHQYMNNQLFKDLENNKQKGTNFSIFSKDHNAFDIIKLSDLNLTNIKLLQLSPLVKSFFVGDLILYYKSHRIERLKAKKEWLENRILYLKMVSSQSNISEEEKEKIQEAIDYYESRLNKINVKLSDIYD